MFRPRPILTLATVLVAALAGEAVRPASETADLDRWHRGPIRYIARADEIKIYKKLETAGDQILFIQRFWVRRDPTPETLTNEYRELFWRRVKEAGDQFVDSPRPGWMTDRGKIHILYGPPQDIEWAPNLKTNALNVPDKGLLRWIYTSRPGGRTDGDAITVVPFVRELTGEYKLSYDPELASVFFNEQLYRDAQSNDLQKMINAMHPRDSSVSVMLDLGRMQEVPPHAQVWLEHVETVEAYGTEPLAVQLTRYEHPDDDRLTVVVITADVSRMTWDSRPAMLARFVPRNATHKQRVLDEETFDFEVFHNQRLGQSRVLLQPGTYDVTIFGVDPQTAETAVFRSTLEVKERTTRPHFSDVVLAHELRSLEYAALASYDEGFQVGPFRVLPNIDQVFRLGDVVNLFYEVYGATPPYRVSYQVEGRETDGSWTPLGQPATGEQNGRAQAWGLPTSPRWPAGRYRLRVDLLDLQERLVSVYVPFTLEAPETG